MMNLKYQLTDTECQMGNVRFDSTLTGFEHITTLKQSLSLLKVKNPAVDFTNDAKAGMFDALSDTEYYHLLHTIEHISKLWKYPDDSPINVAEPMQAEMNVLLLLEHAIREIVILDTMLWDIDYYKEEGHK